MLIAFPVGRRHGDGLKRRFRDRVSWRNLTIAVLLIMVLALAVLWILQAWHGRRSSKSAVVHFASEPQGT